LRNLAASAADAHGDVTRFGQQWQALDEVCATPSRLAVEFWEATNQGALTGGPHFLADNHRGKRCAGH